MYSERGGILRAGWLVWLALAVPLMPAEAAASEWADTSPHTASFVTVNGVRLECLDWGGQGAALILIPGLGDNPHIFDDLAPAFTSRFHVIAYARRGNGRSEPKPPYDTATLTEDLRGLMDALDVSRAHLVGWSLGGNEITTMAVRYPERVGRLVYLDAGYDWSDPDFRRVHESQPAGLLDFPATAMKSLDAYRDYARILLFPGLNDLQRVEAYLRDSVSVREDGSLESRMSPRTAEAIFASLWTSERLDYTRVRSPALAFYADSIFDAHGPDERIRDASRSWERTYVRPFREKSIRKIRRELVDVQVVRMAGSHNSFFLTARDEVVGRMQVFLSGR